MSTIEQAHVDAAEIKHPTFTTISNVECACGCHTLLSMKSVKRGWTVIRGHRVAMSGVVHSKPQANITHMPRTKPGTSVNMDSINQFIDAQLALALSEMKAAETESEKIRYTITQLKEKIEKLRKAKLSLKEI
jgi:hypothetical protein